MGNCCSSNLTIDELNKNTHNNSNKKPVFPKVILFKEKYIGQQRKKEYKYIKSHHMIWKEKRYNRDTLIAKKIADIINGETAKFKKLLKSGLASKRKFIKIINEDTYVKNKGRLKFELSVRLAHNTEFKYYYHISNYNLYFTIELKKKEAKAAVYMIDEKYRDWSSIDLSYDSNSQSNSDESYSS